MREGGNEVQVLDDSDVRRWLTPPLAIEAARSALIGAYEGAIAAPPRLRADLGDVDLVFTAGGFAAGTVGVRVYGTWPGASDQAVLLWDGGGQLVALISGAELGARRTGALGGVAADLLARRGAAVAGVIGSGAQAWAQLWAACAVRDFADVRVFSPSPEHRAAFARRACSELGAPARDVASAREAVEGAEVVLVATRSEIPALDAHWIGPGTHVTTVGPKTVTAHEIPPELAERAAIVATDSPAQAAAYREAFFTTRRLEHLGAIAAGQAPGRTRPDEVTLYCSTGLAGSEVIVADALLRALADRE